MQHVRIPRLITANGRPAWGQLSPVRAVLSCNPSFAMMPRDCSFCDTWSGGESLSRAMSQREIHAKPRCCAYHQSIWPDRSHDLVCRWLCGRRSELIRAARPDRPADLEHAGVRIGRQFAACTGGGSGGAVHIWGGACAGLSGSCGADGGAVCCGPVWCCGKPDVPQRGYCALAFGRGVGLSRARGCAGEAARLSH